MQFDAHKYSYPSRRNLIYAKNGMVATSHPLAAQAGLEILRKGGNAIDAAVATAACLTVVEPTSNGIGGDAFALVWYGGKLHGLNSSGPSAASIPQEIVTLVSERGMPKHGWVPVTVPGIPAAWSALSSRFGRLSLSQALAPAIAHAYEGHPVAPTVARAWENAWRTYTLALKDSIFNHWFDTFAPGGRAPKAGEIWSSPDHGRSLEAIGVSNAEAFYRGNLADRLVDFAGKTGGFIKAADLASFSPEWVEPVSVNYRDYDVWEIPPNGHGLVALMALNILKGFDFDERDSAITCHRQLEAMKLAYADGLRYIADPRSMRISVGQLLSEAYGDERRRLIGDKAGLPLPGRPAGGGTVYLATADGDGNMVSYIQSNYMGFGSGIVVPGTGISLHNRGCNFSVDPEHENCFAPGKKPYHTIIPGFLTKAGKAVGPFGVMGAFMQPQGHVQVIMNTLDFLMNPQDCLDAPRWQWLKGKSVEIEPGYAPDVLENLASRGHDISVNSEPAGFGRGQIIWRNGDGVLSGGTEPRADGAIAAW